MLSTVFSEEEVSVWDGSSRAISPCRFVTAHYDRLIPKIEGILRRYGDKLSDIEGGDILNDLYLKFAVQEKAGIWAPAGLALDAEEMSRYILGTARRMIGGMNDEKFVYQELSADMPFDGSSVEEFLEREERSRQREDLLDRLKRLLFSLGIDADELYLRLTSEGSLEVLRNLPILFGVCYTTEDEIEKMQKIKESLERCSG